MTNTNKQGRLASFLESFWNVAFGFFVALVAWEYFVRPLIHKEVLSVDDSFWITCIFTVISLLRGYIVRRCSVAWSRWRHRDEGGEFTDTTLIQRALRRRKDA